MTTVEIITDWTNERTNVPVYKNGNNHIILLTDYIEESQVTSNTQLLLDLATVEYLKFYFPELWHAHVDVDNFAQSMSSLPNSSQLIFATTNNATSIYNIIKNLISIQDYKKSDRPGSTYKVYIGMYENYNFALRDITNPLFQRPEWIRRASLFEPGQLDTDMPTDGVCPDNRRSLREKNLGVSPGEDLQYRSMPYFPIFSHALDYWNSFRQIELDEQALIVPPLILRWANVGLDLEVIDSTFNIYDAQIKKFDGQISPGINLAQELGRLSEVIVRLTDLMSLNMITPQATDIQIIFDSQYQIAALLGYEGGHRLTQLKVGLFSTIDSEPFVNPQTMVYLKKWYKILELNSAATRNPQANKFEYFIQNIANSEIGHYNVIYCGPSHTPPPGEVIETLSSYGMAQIVKAETAAGRLPNPGESIRGKKGVVYTIPKGSNNLYITFPQSKLRENVIHNPVNQELILSSELERVEETVKDRTQSIGEKIRKIKNSEGMKIFTEVLNKTGLDMLIKEAINCIAFNSSFSYNDITSDVRDFISATENFFEKPRKPMVPKFPYLRVDLNIFSIDGNIELIIRQVLIDFGLAVVQALVEAVVELIRELCSGEDFGGEYGELNLANMFDVKEAKINEPGPITGLNICFSDYLIPQEIGMNYLSDISAVLRPSEICQLLNGNGTPSTLTAVKDFNAVYSENEIRYNLATTSQITAFFSCLGTLVDVSSVCDEVLDNMVPVLDNICLTENDVLSGVDRANIERLLEILENGLNIAQPNINLTCPTAPGYIPNPLVDRSIPQLISALVESVAAPFYFAADATKTILLEPTLVQNSEISCALDAIGGQGQFEESASGPAAGRLMQKIREAFDEMMYGLETGSEGIGSIEENINEFFQRPAELQAEFPCPDIQDVFGGAENIQLIIDTLREVLANFDFSGLSDLQANMSSLASGGPVAMSYRFPKEVYQGIKEFMPSMNNPLNPPDPSLAAEFPYILGLPRFDRIDSNNLLEYKTYFDKWNKNYSTTYTVPEIGDLYGKGATQYTLGYAKLDSDGRNDVRGYGSPTPGNYNVPRRYIEQKVLEEIEGAPPSKKYITTTRVTGSAYFHPGVDSVGQIYGRTEFMDIFGPEAFSTEVNNWEENSANPAQGIFASLVCNSLDTFLKQHEFPSAPESGDEGEALAAAVIYQNRELQLAAKEENLSKYYDALQNQYYFSTRSGLIKQLTGYCLDNGLFTTEKLLKATFVKDNSDCQNDPRKIGDLMDLNGIVKRVQQEYDRSSCSDNVPLRRVVLNCIQYAAVLIFMQVFIAQFYLRNIFILSAIKLDGMWENTEIVNYIFSSIFRQMDEYLQDGDINVQIPGGSTKAFGQVLRQVVNNYVARKYNSSPTSLDPRVLKALGVEPGSEINLLSDNNSMKYVLMKRILDSSLAMQNIISKNSTKSLEDVFIEDVVGFSPTFIVGEGNIISCPDTGTDGQQEIQLSINLDGATNVATPASESDRLFDMMGYGGFKIEKIMKWDKVKFFSWYDGEEVLPAEWQTAEHKVYHWINPDSPICYDISPAAPALQEEILLTATNNPDESAAYQTHTGLKYQNSMSLEKMTRWLQSGDATQWTYRIDLTNLRLVYRLVYYPPVETDIETPQLENWGLPSNTSKNNILKPLYNAVFPLDQLEYGFEPDRFNKILNIDEAFVMLSYKQSEERNVVILSETPTQSMNEAYAIYNDCIEATLQLPFEDRTTATAECIQVLEDAIASIVMSGGEDITTGYVAGSMPTPAQGALDRHRTVGIPLFECGGECLGDVAIADDYVIVTEVADVKEGLERYAPYDPCEPDYDPPDLDEQGNYVLATESHQGAIPSILLLATAAHAQKIKDSQKFQTFFTKVFDKQQIFTSVLMNSFWLTENKFSGDIGRAFTDTVDAAATVFATAVCQPDYGTTPDPGPTGIIFIQRNMNTSARGFSAHGYILKALRETPIKIVKGLAEILDPHVAIWKIVRDITGQVFKQLIDAVDTAFASLPPPLDILDLDAEALFDLMFCGLNRGMHGLQTEAEAQFPDPLGDAIRQALTDSNCWEPGTGALGGPPGLFPKIDRKGVDFTGTLPGLIFPPPGPFGILYLLLNLIPERNVEDTEEEGSSCADETLVETVEEA